MAPMASTRPGGREDMVQHDFEIFILISDISEIYTENI